MGPDYSLYCNNGTCDTNPTQDCTTICKTYANTPYAGKSFCMLSSDPNSEECFGDCDCTSDPSLSEKFSNCLEGKQFRQISKGDTCDNYQNNIFNNDNICKCKSKDRLPTPDDVDALRIILDCPTWTFDETLC